DLTEISAADIAQLRSLGSIADALIAQTGSEAPSPVPSASDTATATAAPSLTRQVVKAVPALPSGQRIGGLTSGSVAITDDGTGIAHQVANRFTELGVEAGVVTRIPADAHGVVFLGGLREVSSVDEALAVNREAFEAARDFARGPAARSGWFVTVQDTGGDFGMNGADHTRAWLGGLAGLARTARLEWPESAVKAIDCERGDRTAEAVADAVVDELLTGGPTSDVGLKADGTRLTLQTEELPVQAQGPAAVDSESVIVATGGARGVTAEVLKNLARAHRPRIALLGRTALGSTPGKLPDTSDTAELTRALVALKAKAGGPPPTPADLKAQVSAVLAEREIQATIDALHAAGAHVRYVAVDVRDTHALDEALGEVRREWGPITGLIHGAGVLADRFLADKTDEDFTKVFDTKVGGLRALLAATESDPLTLLCLFSSVAARCGNPGQSDYAMANEVLNQVASTYAATRPGCLVRSIGWGPWRGGMVTPALAQHFESNQIPLIPIEAGAAAFVAELADTRDVHVVINAVGADSDTGLGAPPPDLLGEIHVTGTTHPYLADHAVAVTPVLPMAMALEWFAAAARAENPGPRPYELQDVSVLRKVTLDRLADEGHRLQVRTTSDVGGRRIDLTDADGTPHFRGRSFPSVSGLQPPAPETPLNLPPADNAELYDGRVLFHGPRFRALSALHGVSDEGASATVIGARDLGWPGAGWHTDPAAVDGGLQLAVLWAERALGGASLPMAMGALRVYRPGLLDGPARCEVRARKVGGAEGECDIRIIDSDGVVRAEMSRVNVVLRPAMTTAALTATGE
ncbi:SDR family NAD(P)-dependent oxidoreductase, partial [Streptomyces chartreusis]